MAAPYLHQLTEKINSLGLAKSKNLTLEYKPLFCGAALYANGRMCATLSPAGFALKLPEQVRKQVLLQGEGKPGAFNQGLEKKEYVFLPASIEKDDQLVKSLLQLSIETAAR